MSQIKATLKQVKGDYSGGGLRFDPLTGNEYSLNKVMGGIFDKKPEVGKAPSKNFKVQYVPKTKDQGSTDFCVGFEVSYTAEQDTPQDEVLSAPFIFAAAKKRYYNGDYSGFGLSITNGLGVLQHDGIPIEGLYPFSGSRNKMANWKNIPDLAWEDAQKRKLDKAYFLVDVYKDKFENFAAAMWHWKEMVITGLNWYSGYYTDEKGRLILNQTGRPIGHCVGAIGVETIDGVRGMWFKNSYNSMPEFWMSETDVRRQMYYGYIAPPIKKDIAELVMKYAGKAIMSDRKDARDVYIVKDGQRHRLANEAVAFAWNVRLWQDVIKVDDADFNSIPDSGKTLTWDSGINAQIVKEIFSLSNSRFEELKNLIK